MPSSHWASQAVLTLTQNAYDISLAPVIEDKVGNIVCNLVNVIACPPNLPFAVKLLPEAKVIEDKLLIP